MYSVGDLPSSRPVGCRKVETADRIARIGRVTRLTKPSPVWDMLYPKFMRRELLGECFDAWLSVLFDARAEGV